MPVATPHPRRSPVPAASKMTPHKAIARKPAAKKPTRHLVPTPSPVLALLPKPLHPQRLSPWIEPIPVPTPPPKRQVWIGEPFAQLVHAVGRPLGRDGNAYARFNGLEVWLNPRTSKISGYQIDNAWYEGAWGVRPGLGLKTVLKLLPHSDGIFHVRPTTPGGSESVLVLASENGLIVQFEHGDQDWLASRVEGRTPSGVMDYYQDLRSQAHVQFIAPDYFFALDARHRPLP